MAGLRELPRRRSRPVLPRAGCLDRARPRRLPRVCGCGRMPRVRAGQRREVRHLGRHERARAPPHPPAACRRPVAPPPRPESELCQPARTGSAARPTARIGASRAAAGSSRRASIVRSAARSSCGPALRRRCGRAPTAGTRPTSSARRPRARRRPRSHASAGPTTSGATRFIDTCTPSPTGRPSARRCGPRTAPADPPGPGRGRVRQPDVLRHQQRAGAHGDRPGGRVGPAGPAVGRRASGTPPGAPRAASARARRGTPGTPSSSADPGREPVAGGDGVGQRRRRRSGTNGTTSTTPMRGWTPAWSRRSSRSTGRRGHRPGRVLADQRQHRPVVVGGRCGGRAGRRRPRRRARRARRGRRPSLTFTTHSSTTPDRTPMDSVEPSRRRAVQCRP